MRVSDSGPSERMRIVSESERARVESIRGRKRE